MTKKHKRHSKGQYKAQKQSYTFCGVGEFKLKERQAKMERRVGWNTNRQLVMNFIFSDEYTCFSTYKAPVTLGKQILVFA